MKKKYIIGIILIVVIIFGVTEIFMKNTNKESNNDNNITNGNVEKIDKNSENSNMSNTIENSITNNNEDKKDNTRINNGEELMQKADKTVSARGWAGASNNVIGLKNGIIYYYNKGTEEFYTIAEGVDDIYYATDDDEEITAKRNNSFKEIKEAPEFLIYE